jgi:hypothetical protein
MQNLVTLMGHNMAFSSCTNYVSGIFTDFAGAGGQDLKVQAHIHVLAPPRSRSSPSVLGIAIGRQGARKKKSLTCRNEAARERFRQMQRKPWLQARAQL